MSCCYLYGMIETNESKDFGPIGFEENGQGKGEVKATGSPLGAVVGPSPFESVEHLNKETLVKTLMTHQETLEAIMKKEFILPCKFGTVLKDEKEIQEILSQNEAFIREWLSKMKNACELDLIGTWDPRPVITEIAQKDPGIIQMTKKIPSLPPLEREREKISLGVQLSSKLKAKAREVAQTILKTLQTVSKENSEHDVMNDEMVCNISFLVDQSGLDKFYKTLEELDLHLDGRLNFRCVGPLPPYSFATVVLKRFEKSEILWAQKVLGIYSTVTNELVKRAYKNLASQCHPDTHPEASQKEFEILNQAYKFLMGYCEGGCKHLRLSLMKVEEPRIET